MGSLVFIEVVNVLIRSWPTSLVYEWRDRSPIKSRHAKRTQPEASCEVIQPIVSCSLQPGIKIGRSRRLSQAFASEHFCIAWDSTFHFKGILSTDHRVSCRAFGNPRGAHVVQLYRGRFNTYAKQLRSDASLRCLESLTITDLLVSETSIDE